LMGDHILQELDDLPDEYRLAVTLCDAEGLSYQEVADALEVPIGTVRSRLFRGRRLLREKLAWMQQIGGEPA
ncbi:MAG TPA: sigma factor-like helix-turn-helix DNA-binding protein, partial [Fimbriimonas sp.]|nr:sigma factor-like helix-turn-helix DNA-binding protein [Fimbriimonas sp.]